MIEEAYKLRALQRSPHLVLLNAEWYHAKMMPVMAKWMLLWLEANHISGLKTDQIEAYITSNGDALVGRTWDAWVEERAAKKEADAMAAGVPPKSDGERALLRLYAFMDGTLADSKKAFQLLNMSSEWLRIYLPHCVPPVAEFQPAQSMKCACHRHSSETNNDVLATTELMFQLCCAFLPTPTHRPIYALTPLVDPSTGRSSRRSTASPSGCSRCPSTSDSSSRSPTCHARASSSQSPSWARTCPRCVEWGALSSSAEAKRVTATFVASHPMHKSHLWQRASEFAHPDIIIGLTILAYRYEGLRKLDFEQDVITLLRSEFEKEVGPYKLRKSAQRYETWVAQAGGQIKGKKSEQAQEDDKRDDGDIGVLEDDNVVVPLWLLKQSNDDQMQKLFALLRKQPTTIHWYLENVIFPSFMQHQRLKLSASGQELGGSMLFSRRLGFSGTPSDLLPLDLGSCHH